MKTTALVYLLALASLTGCASQSQIELQNQQLAALNVQLTKIEAYQAQSAALQNAQLAALRENNDLQMQKNEQSPHR